MQATPQMYAFRDLLGEGLACATGAPAAAGARAGAAFGPVTSMWASPRPYPVGASAGARYELPEAPKTTAWLCPKTELVAFTVVFTVVTAAACTAEDTAC